MQLDPRLREVFLQQAPLFRQAVDEILDERRIAQSVLDKIEKHHAITLSRHDFLQALQQAMPHANAHERRQLEKLRKLYTRVGNPLSHDPQEQLALVLHRVVRLNARRLGLTDTPEGIAEAAAVLGGSARDVWERPAPRREVSRLLKGRYSYQRRIPWGRLRRALDDQQKASEREEERRSDPDAIRIRAQVLTLEQLANAKERAALERARRQTGGMDLALLEDPTVLEQLGPEDRRSVAGYLVKRQRELAEPAYRETAAYLRWRRANPRGTPEAFLRERRLQLQPD